MYIKKLHENLINRGFKINDEEDPCEYVLKINDELQILVVSTEENYIMLVSEHKIIDKNKNNELLDYENIEILSEGVFEDEIIEFFKKYEINGLISNPE